MNDNTWEQAAWSAIEMMSDDSFNFSWDDLDTANECETAISFLKAPPMRIDRHNTLSALYNAALHRYVVMTGQERGQAELGIYVVLCSKQHDYGHDNILWGGFDGVLIRMHDKTARIKNLVSRGSEALNESLADSWLDIAGYAVIAHMLNDGTFELPLAQDAPDSVEVTP